MPDIPRVAMPPLNVITPWHLEANPTRPGVGSLATVASLAPGQNFALYFPFTMFQAATAVKMSYPTGTTANGNADVGIYDDQKNRLVSSGSVTAQAAANTMNTIDITDTLLLPGRYFMAIELSSATGTLMVNGTTDEVFVPELLIFTESPGSATLPATANWAVSPTASPYLVALGVHFDTLV